MKVIALFLASAAAIRTQKEALAQMPTAQETLCQMRRDGKLNLEDTYFQRGKTFNEHRDGGFNTQALVQVKDDDKKQDKVLDQTSFERHLQQNMGNGAGLVYNANF